MALVRIPRDARHLVADHQELQNKMTELVISADNSQMEVRKAAEAMLEDQVREVLRGIPVEELNRDHRGIRVKTLREQGYADLEALSGATRAELERISGISDEGAVEIREAVAELSRQARTGLRLRLSADHRTEAATALLQAIDQYLTLQEAAAEPRELLTRNRRKIDRAIQELSAGIGLLHRLFASRAEKERALAAYELLQRLKTGPYGKSAKTAVRRWKTMQISPTTDPWPDFQVRPVAYIQALDELCPEMLGKDETLGGLPGQIAHAVQEQPMDLQGLRCQLRRYQQWGVRYILHQKRVLLGDEMGLGKTVQAIAAMVALRNDGQSHFLVVCPASVLENWCREIRKHSDLPVIRIHGADREQALQQWLQTGAAAVTTYETTGMIRLEAGRRLGLLVVDEAHYVKNPEAQRTVQVHRLCDCTDRVLFMTGTALENRVDEMISLISVLQPDVAQRVEGMASLSAAPQFREEIAPVYYRRKREDVLTELPDLIEKEEWCVLGEQEQAVYEAAVLDQKYNEARRVSWNVENPAQSCKARRLMELVEKAEDQERKVLIFSFFLDTLQKVTELLGDRCLEPINGSVSPQRRQEIVDEFDRSPAGTVLAAQIQAGGTGLNIQSASVVILCEPQFKPSTENQAISRAYRMGQTRNVLVHRLLCEDTVDECILQLLARKQAAFDAFADDSAAAEQTPELDSAGFGKIMDAERLRITGKQNPKPSDESEQNL